MTHKPWLKLLVILFAFGLVAAACGSDDDEEATEEEVTEEEAPEEEAPEEEAPEEEAPEEEAAGSLAGVCPDPLVVQTDWFPESEHGAMYQLIGEGYEVDVDNKVVRGPMVAGGEPTGIDFEVRTGGPAIGFQPVSSVVYTDDGIHLAYQTTDAMVLQHADTPMLSVVAPLEKNPQIIMWDPETYPDVETLADLGEQGITINVFAGGVFSEVFVAQGLWDAGQIDPSYDGSPARFIAEDGAIAQQGFASAEPYTYENEFEEWGKPVNFQLLHDTGFELYSQTIAVRPDTLEDLRPCLEQVVPMIQQAQVDFANDPARANATIIDAVEQYADFWVYDEGLAEFSVAKQVELGIISNGPDDTLGNMEEDRIQSVIDQIAATDLDVPDDLVAADLFTNEFIDPSIGLAGGGEEAAGEEETAAGSLAGVCPDPLVIQTDWFPESEHGAMYELIGEGYEVDVNNKVVRGPMVAGGEPTGIDVEVRTGGPAIGFQPVSSVVYTDDGIHLAYQTTDAMILQHEDTPMLSVVAPLEKNPQIIMWDPETYPDVATIADLGEEGVTINVFAGGVFSEVFTALGIWDAGQIDPSYDGSPARFIAEDGAIAQQGFASAEPFQYENEFEEWGKPVNFQLLHDAGFELYSQTIAIRPDTKDDLDACLQQVVPMIQQAAVDFVNDPARANAIIIDAVAQYADFWVYEQGVADYSVQTQLDLGLVGNGPDDTLGNMEEDRIQGVIDQISQTDLDVPEGLEAADLFTNEYIDESIGL